MMTTWRTEIIDAMAAYCETFEDVIECTLSDAEIDESFDGSYGTSKGKSFTLWTKRRVYFPAVYDGLEWVESVSREPDGKPTRHVGGE